MIRPHYKKAEDEGRTLVQTIPAGCGGYRTGGGRASHHACPARVHPIGRGSSNPFARHRTRPNDVSRHSASNALCRCATAILKQKADRCTVYHVRSSEVNAAPCGQIGETLECEGARVQGKDVRTRAMVLDSARRKRSARSVVTGITTRSLFRVDQCPRKL
jgi:hypothetical protein